MSEEQVKEKVRDNNKDMDKVAVLTNVTLRVKLEDKRKILIQNTKNN